MIKTIIFDFGDVFINLDKQGAMTNALNLFQLDEFEPDMIRINQEYETGRISTPRFIEFYKAKFSFLSEYQIIEAWNTILKDFPSYRLNFLKQLKQLNTYKLILLSNTNQLHIEWVKSQIPFYNSFKGCFDSFYLSHEIHLRKPDRAIFEFVLSENQARPHECLFIDDTKENTDSAKAMGFHVWHINESKEDVINLFTIKKELF